MVRQANQPTRLGSRRDKTLFERGPAIRSAITLAKLYALVDEQTRALVQFAIVASQPYIDGLSTSAAPVVEPPPAAKPQADG